MRRSRVVTTSRQLLLALALTAGALVVTTAPAAADPEVERDRSGAVTYDDGSVDADTTLTGQLNEVVEELPGGESRTFYVIDRPDGRQVVLDLADDLPPGVSGGDVTARVERAQPGDEAAVESLQVEPATPAAAAAEPKAHRVYLAIAEGVETSDATIQAAVRAALADWVEDANGAITTFTIARTRRFDATCTTSSDVAIPEARAQFPGLDTGSTSGNHLVLFGVTTDGCSSFGLGSVGAGIASGGWSWIRESDDTGSPLTYTKYTRAALGHEIGHNLSLGHAGLRSCDPTCGTIGAPDGGEYGNRYSMMGSSGANVGNSALDSISREKLDVLDTCELLAVSSPAGTKQLTGTWSLAARTATSGPRGLKVVDPSTGRALWLDYRSKTGRDATSQYRGSTWPAGVTIQQADGDSTDRSTDLLTRGLVDDDDFQPVVLPGRPRTVGGVTVSVGSVGGDRAAVTVRLDRATGSAAPAMPGSVSLPATTPGRTITPTLASYPAGACHERQWLRDGEPIVGATGATYTSTSADLGHVLSLRVTTSAGGYAPRTVTSNGVGVYSAAPSIRSTGSSGYVRVDSTASISAPADWSTARSYAWLRNGSTVVGTSPTYQPTAADVASASTPTLSLRVTFTEGGATTTRTTAARTIFPNLISAATPTVSGTPKLGRTLTARPGTWSPAPTTFQYRWQYYAGSRWNDLAYGVKSTYVPTAYYAGKKLRVRVTGVRPGYYSVTRYSRATATVAR